ncbi:hypothetical protein [Anaerococcus degeneri]|uniref:Uncharacterized protein n=1 Tax=Anaerococcus degeneri TaxID=361500 RepID=A0ABS7YYH9_9FIRM|nr:hypothetical protein [Anaerococcus degeneri]MBP2014573.1 putative transcriptional regulator [Anaerococcus degeneri]MCA2096786.1 hypothetical protein [Anaerococcus degeneri]
MDRLKELKEARSAADMAIAKIDCGLGQLESASSWGILDILGGGLISSLVKRNKIGEANHSLEEISLSLKALNKELNDVDISLPDAIPDRLSDEVFDLVFDNIFTDIRVQGEIKENLVALKELRHAIVEVRDKVDREIKELED